MDKAELIKRTAENELMQFLGVKIVETEPDCVVLTMEVNPKVHQYVGMEFETYFRAVEAIMDEYDGRPHWGKRHYQTAATLKPRYPDWDKFREIRDRFDSDRRFENDYLRRVVG